MDAATDYQAQAQGVRRWRKRFGWASIVSFFFFFCIGVYSHRQYYEDEELRQKAAQAVQAAEQATAELAAPPAKLSPDPPAGEPLMRGLPMADDWAAALGSPKKESTIARMVYGPRVARALTNANVRKGPSPNTRRVGTVSSGDRLIIDEEVEGAKGQIWFRVRLQNGTAGYIFGELIAVEAPPLDLITQAEIILRYLRLCEAAAPEAERKRIRAQIEPISDFLSRHKAASTPHEEDPPELTGPGRLESVPIGGNFAPTSAPMTSAPMTSAPMTSAPMTSAPMTPVLISAGALAVSLLGFLSTTVMAWRIDWRAIRAEVRAQEEHGWKKADREATHGFGL